MFNIKVFFTLFCIVFLPPALADKVQLEEKVSVIEYVDNQQGLVVAGDAEYRLKLGTKVSDDTGRNLNRYALKVGETVVLEAYYENGKAFLESVVILKKKKK